MRNTLRFAIFLLIAFSSCKKSGGTDGPIPLNTITATVDGVNVNFSVSAKAIIGTITQYGGTSDVYIGIYGQTGADDNRALLDVVVTLYPPATQVTTGTYPDIDANSPAGFAVLLYEKFSSNPPGTHETTTLSNSSYQTFITITSISSGSVQGTFSGTLQNPSDLTTANVITNGKFNVALNN
jgi:hypothetical protein